MTHRIWFVLCVLVGAGALVIAVTGMTTLHPLLVCWNLFSVALMAKCASQIGWSNK